jgi:hypothetical protein
MNLTRLRSILEQEANQADRSKLSLLEKLHEFFQEERRADPQLGRIMELLEARDQLPVAFSRFNMQDLSRRVGLMSWKKKASVVQSIESIVEDCTTVSGGDCDKCMGDELVYMWDLHCGKLVKCCLLCSATLDLVGTEVVRPLELIDATELQLREAGAIG